MKMIALLIACFAATPVTAQEPAAVLPTLVVPDPTHPWAAAQIGSVLAGNVAYHEGSLLQALTLARSGEASGVIEIKLETSAAFESGRVVCYSPSGRKLWEEKVMFNLGGGEERIARRFADSLELKVAGKSCSKPGT
jgi:hypothetical protein